jgi:hypothetical protein
LSEGLDAAPGGASPISGRADAAFYCVADERYFLGVVGLINSLRLLGHHDPIYLLDCGLTSQQRDLLVADVTVVPAPTDSPPWLLKTVAPLRYPARVMVLLDADMIITRSLRGLIEKAAPGRLVACRDRDEERFFAEWRVLGLGEPRRQPYVSSGFVFLGEPLGDRVLTLLGSAQDHVDFELTFWRRNRRDYPFLYADQDVLNAILATSVEPEAIVALDNSLAPNPPFRGLRLLDEASLQCAHRDGTEPYVLHQFVRKPWLERMYHGIYSRLLARLLLGSDVAVRVPASMVPRRMRTGPVARVERMLVNAVDLARYYLGDLLPERVEAVRSRRGAKQP